MNSLGKRLWLILTLLTLLTFVPFAAAQSDPIPLDLPQGFVEGEITADTPQQTYVLPDGGEGMLVYFRVESLDPVSMNFTPRLTLTTPDGQQIAVPYSMGERGAVLAAFLRASGDHTITIEADSRGSLFGSAAPQSGPYRLTYATTIEAMPLPHPSLETIPSPTAFYEPLGLYTLHPELGDTVWIAVESDDPDVLARLHRLTPIAAPDAPPPTVLPSAGGPPPSGYVFIPPSSFGIMSRPGNPAEGIPITETGTHLVLVEDTSPDTESTYNLTVTTEPSPMLTPGETVEVTFPAQTSAVTYGFDGRAGQKLSLAVDSGDEASYTVVFQSPTMVTVGFIDPNQPVTPGSLRVEGLELPEDGRYLVHLTRAADRPGTATLTFTID